ncbi:palmitoyltransferase pfa5 [Tritrichomonas musculus]|uniref:Palmitoyltransferase n=1 Tax=Tritrichomonas musculus TaxID=1915356 RepID=A0ABR2JJE2_9EUKA
MIKKDETAVCKNPHEYEGKTIMVEGELQHVPMFSKWRYICKCCGGRCNLVYFPAIKRYFCNQWECNLRYPVPVVFFLCVSYAMSVVAMVEFMYNAEKIAMLILTSISFFFWIVSYFCACCRSPGYLPFYWAVEKKEVFTFEQQMDGVCTNDEQKEFACYNGRPERGSFSQQAHRLVLKADHICKWIANWVGLKNYRYFYLKVLWSIIYFLCWFIDFILVFVRIGQNGWKTKVGNIGMLICVLPMLGFFVFIFIIFRRHTRYTIHNTTTLQQFRLKKNPDKHNYYDLGCWNNCVQVFGPEKCCICWFFPVPIKREWGGFRWKTNRPIPKDDDESDGNQPLANEDHVNLVESAHDSEKPAGSSNSSVFIENSEIEKEKEKQRDLKIEASDNSGIQSQEDENHNTESDY